MQVEIPNYWKRISGMHAEENGDLGIVWLAIDDRSNVVWCYDAAVFKVEVFPVIADSLSNRGGIWIPLAWRKEDEKFALELQKKAKINITAEASADKSAWAEVASREILLRMRGNRFKCDPSVYQWLDEFNRFYRNESKVPQEGFPLMAATRHAIELLSYARAQSMPGSKRTNHPKVAIL